MLTNHALTSMRTFLKNNIAYAKYKVGSTYYQAPIQSADILADGRVAVTFVIDHTVAGNITVTEVQLYDHSGIRGHPRAKTSRARMHRKAFCTDSASRSPKNRKEE